MIAVGVGVGVGFGGGKNKVIVFDDFNRAGSSVSLGKAVTGQTWTYSGAGFGINNGQAYALNDYTAALIDCTKQDIKLSVDLVVNGDGRIYPKYVSSTTHLRLQKTGTFYYPIKEIDGATTTLGAYNGAANGDKIEIICSGTNVKVFINGIQRLTADFDAVLNTSTKVGFYSNLASNNGRFDNFKVEEL